jgi:hypothetical protein
MNKYANYLPRFIAGLVDLFISNLIMQIIRLVFVLTNVTQGKSSYFDISHAEASDPGLNF